MLADLTVVMGWDLVVIRWFCELCYCVVGSEGDSNVIVLNMLVILRVCGDVKVKVAHFGLFSVLVGGVARVILCCIWRFIL